jgi:hypothetical protein
VSASASIVCRIDLIAVPSGALRVAQPGSLEIAKGPPVGVGTSAIAEVNGERGRCRRGGRRLVRNGGRRNGRSAQKEAKGGGEESAGRSEHGVGVLVSPSVGGWVGLWRRG